MSDVVATDREPTAGPRIVRRLLGDLPYYLLAQVIGSALSVASIAVFTRLLDRSSYGAYALVLAGVTVVGEFTFGWLHQSALRFWHASSKAEDTAVLERFLSGLLALFGWATLSAAVAWPLLSPLLFPGVGWPAAAAGFGLLLGQTGVRLAQTRTRITRELKAYFWYAILPPLCGLLLGITLVAGAGARAVGLLIAFACGYLLTALIEITRRWRAYVPVTIRHDATQRREITRFGLPIAIGAIGGVALDLSDRFLVAHMFGLGTAGEYAAAYGLAIKVDALTMLVVSAAFPLLIQDYEDRPREKVGAELSHLITMFLTFYAPAVCGVALIAAPLVAIFLGPDFQNAASYIVPLMPGVLFMGCERYVSKAFQLSGHNGKRLVIIAVAAAVNLVLNIAFLRRLGPVFAAWTTSLGFLVMIVLEYVWSRRHFPYRLEWGAIGRITLATMGMGAIVIAATATIDTPALQLGARVGVGVGAYAILGFGLDVGGLRTHWRRRTT